ncbi:GNAT family N-acetyltransferase [Micromonospora sp. WMMD882]|uniref:GNAT family N-acetyltransferase n=1 Tax=Micromonospora sp. WMMD882 TaxID=3015151 RepID=UPI00248CA4E5|nr:GNAT family N-acetyltransferase [Micromonospora sp. WMMD882]WBB79563.1 GNAT family N-acetyltransferase [Micromonospora sp. WMMD882]
MTTRAEVPPLRLEPMTEDGYDRYRAGSEAGYVDSIVASGSMPRAEAEEKARADLRRLLPDGPRTAGHHFWTLHDDGAGVEVGILWLHVETKSDGRHAFVYDVEVHEGLRRRGYGRGIMQAVDRWCREARVATVGLNVFGHNTGARALYEEMGYQVTSVQMRKFL